MTTSLTYGSPELDELIDSIGADARAREHNRTQPHDQIRLLRDQGLGAFRVPVDEGGSGASLPELFDVVIRLAHADTNVAHILRSHFWFVEDRLQSRDLLARKKWLAKVVEGELFGNASSETGTRDIGDFQTSTTVTPAEDGSHRINGVKYYSTGTDRRKPEGVAGRRRRTAEGPAMRLHPRVGRTPDRRPRPAAGDR